MDRKYYLEQILKGVNTLNSNLYLKEMKTNVYHYELAEQAINIKYKNWYNKRIDDWTNKDSNKWEHLTKKYLEESKKIESIKTNPIFDKVYRSRFGKINLFESSYPKNMDQIYISDYIMFNPNCEISFDMMDRILPYIKFKKIDSNTVQIDRWIFKNKGFFIVGSDRPNYEISYSNKELDSEQFVKTEEDKWYVVRAMLQIMNDTPDEFVNFNSYQVIGHWYNKNDSWLVSWDPNNYKDKKGSESDVNLKHNKLTKSDLLIKLGGRLKKNELIDLLYDYAIYGGNDLKKIGIKFEPDTFTSITGKIMQALCDKVILNDNSPIETISDAKINTIINLDKLDLSGYLEANGEERTRELISQINNQIKYRFNCENVIKPDGNKISRSDLLARMYNLSLPFGLGIISQAEKIKSDGINSIMTISDVDKLIDEKTDYYSDGNKVIYFDYLHGIPIKMDFSTFPIVNYRQFEKYNGTGSFAKCIESLSEELDVNKTLPTKEYIKSEIKRISQ
jgi:hypothetical protein